MNYKDLCEMPVDELIEIIKCANDIGRKREQELKRGK